MPTPYTLNNNELQDSLSRLSAFVPQAQPKKKKRNFWLDQISTGTGIAGGIAGSFVSPILGTGAGAALGSGLGEALENAIDPENGDWGNVAQEAALGGVFGAGPIKLLKGAGAGVRALSSGADDVAGAASRAATTSMFNRGARMPLGTVAKDTVGNGVKSVTQQTLKTSFPGKANALGNKALASQYGTIGKNVARETDPLNTISKLADYGILKPKDAETVARSITGSNGLLTQAVASAASGAGKVNLKGVQSVLDEAIAKNGLVDSEAKSVTNTVLAQMKSLATSGGDANSVMKVMRNLESRAANLMGKGGNYRMATPERIDQANVLRAVRDELEDKLYRVAGGNKNLPNVLTPELRNNLVNLVPGNVKWQSFIDNDVMKAKDIGKLRSAQAPFVKINKIIDEADVNSVTFGGRASESPFNGGTFTNSIANILTKSVKNPSARAVSQPLRSFGNPITTAGRGNQGITGSLGIAGRLGTAGLASSDRTQPQTLDEALGYSAGPNSSNSSLMTMPMTNSAANIPNTVNMGASYSNSDPLSNALTDQSPYSKEALLYDIQRDPKNMGDYIATYETMQEIFNPDTEEAESPYGRPSAEKYALASSGLGAIDQLEQMIASDPSLVSRSATPGQKMPLLGGLISRAAGTGEYEAYRQNIMDTIARARTGAAMSPNEERFYDRYVPRAGDSDQTIQAKFALARQALSPFLGYQGGGDPLTEALMSSGQAY